MSDSLKNKNISIDFGKYKIVSEVGSGGLGRVFRAVDQTNGETVAIKVLHDRFIHSKKFLGIFHRELMVFSKLHHKNIVRYIDGEFVPPNCYIVSEFVDGWSLHKFMKKVGRVPPLVGLSILWDILQGLDHLHLHDTVHSDLSSPNVLINKEGRILLTDFGLACELDVEDYKNLMVGTPGYYSPEHITDSPITETSDIYNAALLTYELITGHKAVLASPDRKKIIPTMKKIDYSLIKSSDPKLEIATRKILKSALHFSAKKRTQNCEKMIMQVYEVLSKYKIRFARMAIKEFLMSVHLIPKQDLSNGSQPIYHGFYQNSGEGKK